MCILYYIYIYLVTLAFVLPYFSNLDICVHMYVCVCLLFLQSCLTLCNPLDCSPPGSCVLGFSKQGYWSGLPSPPPEDLPNSGIEPRSLMSPALADGFFTTSATWEAHMYVYIHVFLFFTTVFNPENSFWNISSFLQLNI